MAVTTPEYVSQTPLAPAPKKRRTGLIVGLVIGAVVLVATATAVSVALTRPSAGVKSSSPTVPVVETIPRPNAACIPAADRKISLGEDLTKVQWFGWLDGKQVDLPLSQVLAQRVAGHDVRDAWYCPPRANW
jgi:hypothetical protein